jgi:hypothetical protein
MYTAFWSVKPEGREVLQVLGADGRIILKPILKNYYGRK